MKLKGEIMEPRPLKAKVLLWADISYSDMEEMDKIKAIPELERILCSVLGIEVAEPRRGVLLELYVNTVLFSREKNFNREQTSALLSIVKSLHQANIETPLDNMDHCFAYCSELLLCHSVRRPPFSIQLFSCEQVTQILQYLLNTYMRHYVLYKYIFTPQVQLDLSLSYSGMPEDSAHEESVSPDGGSEVEEEGETEGENAQSSTSLELLSTEPEVTERGPSHKTELRTIVQQEVREEVMRLTSQLEQRLRESADQLNSALTSLETNLRSKK